jgi:GR25 family glycosyltransferase involved in LPS biosynthesis
MSDFDFECHVINLARTPERLEEFLRHNAKTGLPFRRFEAVDGNDLSDEGSPSRANPVSCFA